MSLDLIRLIIDFGFAVLIWAVQLVIYPSFKFYSEESLVKWHRLYTARVTLIVLPLMFSQLITALLQLWNNQNWYTIFSIICVSLLWGLTFIVFVPLHQRIGKNSFDNSVCIKLIQKNWLRTLLWNLLFISSVIFYVFK